MSIYTDINSFNQLYFRDYFRPGMDRYQAEAELINEKKGAFFIRLSSITDHFALSYRDEDGVSHALLVSKNGKYRLSDEDDSKFRNLDDILKSLPLINVNWLKEKGQGNSNNLYVPPSQLNGLKKPQTPSQPFQPSRPKSPNLKSNLFPGAKQVSEEKKDLGIPEFRNQKKETPPELPIQKKETPPELPIQKKETPLNFFKHRKESPPELPIQKKETPPEFPIQKKETPLNFIKHRKESPPEFPIQKKETPPKVPKLTSQQVPGLIISPDPFQQRGSIAIEIKKKQNMDNLIIPNSERDCSNEVKQVQGVLGEGEFSVETIKEGLRINSYNIEATVGWLLDSGISKGIIHTEGTQSSSPVFVNSNKSSKHQAEISELTIKIEKIKVLKKEATDKDDLATALSYKKQIEKLQKQLDQLMAEENNSSPSSNTLPSNTSPPSSPEIQIRSPPEEEEDFPQIKNTSNSKKQKRLSIFQSINPMRKKDGKERSHTIGYGPSPVLVSEPVLKKGTNISISDDIQTLLESRQFVLLQIASNSSNFAQIKDPNVNSSLYKIHEQLCSKLQLIDEKIESLGMGHLLKQQNAAILPQKTSAFQYPSISPSAFEENLEITIEVIQQRQLYLVPDWQAHYSSEGIPYWYSPSLQISSWFDPVWQRSTTEQGEVYWFNHFSQESTWNDPYV